MVSFGLNIDSFTDFEWNSPEYRQYISGYIIDSERELTRLSETEYLYKKQTEYVALLERQMKMLQKTLDIAEKFAPRIICMPGGSEVIK